MGKTLKKSNVIIVSDPHLPAVKDGYFEFIRDTKRKYQCGSDLFIGDIYDFAAMSFHQKNPKMPSAEDEFNKAYKMVRRWYKLMPNAVVMTGNHDDLPQRQAEACGILDRMINGLNDVFDTPNWDWKPRYYRYVTEEFGSKIIFSHGDCGKGGLHAAMKNAKEHFTSYVQGHLHSQAGVNWFANEGNLVFGMNVGAGMNWETLAMDYGRKFTAKPVISCGVIADGIPMVIPMDFKKYS